MTIFLGAGYLFGNIQWVQDYLAVALAIAVAASAIPGFIIWAVHHLRRRPGGLTVDASRRTVRPPGTSAARPRSEVTATRLCQASSARQTDDHWSPAWM